MPEGTKIREHRTCGLRQERDRGDTKDEVHDEYRQKESRAIRLGRAAVGGCLHVSVLDIEILHIERVVLDELAAGFYVFAHQRREDRFRFRDVL